MKPRILFLDHTGSLGGAELYLLDAARHFKDTCEVVLFEEGPFHEALRSENIPTEVFPAPDAFLGVKKQSSAWSALKALPGVARLVRRVARRARSFDVLYANSQKALIVSAVAGLLARHPVIWNLHDMLTADHFSDFNRRVAVWCANWGTDCVIVNSRATEQAFIESGGHASKTAVVYNGIESTPFETVSEDDVESLRRELGLDGASVVGVFSRLAPWKGQHVLLKALGELQGVHTLVVGEALFDGDAAYADRLRTLVRRKGLEDRVHFLGFRDDIPRLMKLCDVVVHTSVAPEPFGRVIVEGLLARCPVVATCAGGAAEIIEDGKTGMLVSPGDSEQLAHALNRLLSHPDEAQAMAEAGHRMARSRFSIENMLDGISTSIQRVLSRSQPTKSYAA